MVDIQSVQSIRHYYEKRLFRKPTLATSVVLLEEGVDGPYPDLSKEEVMSLTEQAKEAGFVFTSWKEDYESVESYINFAMIAKAMYRPEENHIYLYPENGGPAVHLYISEDAFHEALKEAALKPLQEELLADGNVYIQGFKPAMRGLVS